MNQIKKLLIENLNYIFTILKPYKNQKITTHIPIALQDFIQIFSRLQLIQTKLQQLFSHYDNFQKIGTTLSQTQKLILQEKNELQQQILTIEKILLDESTTNFSESLKQTQIHDISQLCGEAFKNLLDNQSLDFTKLSQIQKPLTEEIGEWDSKLESDREKTNEFQKIKNAFQVLDKAKIFEPSNLQMLMKCSENTDKQIYLDFFLQIINIQRKQQSNTQQTNEKSPELREQVLQMPICQEFSFESPLPSLREQNQPQQQFKHVKLEDLLKIEERLISEQSPNKQHNFIKKQTIQKTNIENSFYSQNNIKNLIKKSGSNGNNQIQREKSPSEHISRSSQSLLVEQSQSTRQQKEVFRRKISQPTSITERNGKIL